MIRPATSEDRTAIIAIAEAIGLFSPLEFEELGSMLAEYFEGNSDDNSSFFLSIRS